MQLAQVGYTVLNPCRRGACSKLRRSSTPPGCSDQRPPRFENRLLHLPRPRDAMGGGPPPPAPPPPPPPPTWAPPIIPPSSPERDWVWWGWGVVGGGSGILSSPPFIRVVLGLKVSPTRGCRQHVADPEMRDLIVFLLLPPGGSVLRHEARGAAKPIVDRKSARRPDPQSDPTTYMPPQMRTYYSASPDAQSAAISNR